MSNLCRDCLAFDPIPLGEGNDLAAKLGRGLCHSDKVLDDQSVQFNPTHPDPDEPDCLFAGCDEQRSILTVGPEFGCIHWEPKA